MDSDTILNRAEDAIARMLRAERRGERLEGLLRKLVEDERNFTTGYWVAVDCSLTYCNFCHQSHADRYAIEHTADCPVLLARAAISDGNEDGHAVS